MWATGMMVDGDHHHHHHDYKHDDMDTSHMVCSATQERAWDPRGAVYTYLYLTNDFKNVRKKHWLKKQEKKAIT